jgi:sugar porter (SP) family MFS transporter
MSINFHVVKSTVVGALGGLLFGFDTAVISGTTNALTQTYQLSPALLGVTVTSALLGTVIGAITAGIPGQKFGRRDSLRVMAIFYVISALGCAFAWNWTALIFFRFIGGLGIGGSSVLGPMYIAEIAPPEWRGRLVGCFQLNVVVGILLAYISNAWIDGLRLGATEWRWQLGISAVPALLFLFALFGIPRSPRWLVMQGKLEESLSVLRLTGIPKPEGELEEIVASIHQERAAAGDPLFSRQYRFPIFLAITVGMFCQLSGINAVLYYLNDIFTLAGATKVSGALQAVAVGATNLVATLAAMSVIDQFGRKKLLLIGTVGLAICLTAVAYVLCGRRARHWEVQRIG